MSDIQKWNNDSHIKLTGISGHLWLAIAHLEQYKRELPIDSNEHHQIACSLRHAKRALVAYSLTRHSQQVSQEITELDLQEDDKIRLLDRS
ncbi:hypothetical protein [Nostoc sp. MS1]|uniref:hypothetical protein n=1 Tax=Nostoc sp. MS1 TaxID=2764711 RepID=UPI001CC7365E|nr:hypothetical protein [Nostoc sp. MS1]BCL34592.1 hypothetical protein NSMS1_10390 [Nostoc sp. MS1]